MVLNLCQNGVNAATLLISEEMLESAESCAIFDTIFGSLFIYLFFGR